MGREGMSPEKEMCHIVFQYTFQYITPHNKLFLFFFK